MLAETKRRTLASLVTLAVVFALLGTYYFIQAPRDMTAFVQATVVMGILLTLTLVVHFVPAKPSATAEEVPAKVERQWNAERDFEPGEAASSTLAGRIHSATAALAASVNPHSMATPTAVATNPPPASPPSHPIPSARAASVSAEPLIETIAAIEIQAAAEPPMAVADLQTAYELPLGRNDDVRIHEPIHHVAPLAAVAAPVPRPAPAARVETSTPSHPITLGRRAVWHEPDVDAPRELLRELADYWHMKYETERDRVERLYNIYEESLRHQKRVVEPETIEGAGSGADARPVGGPLGRSEGALLQEDRWDSSTAQMERFH